MTTQRSTGSRRTIVRTGDARVAGHYEPTAFWPSISADYASAGAEMGDDTVGIVCSGRVRSNRWLSYPALVRAARQLVGGTFGLPMVDLLAVVGLDLAADVVVFTDRNGDQLAVPVRELMHHGLLLLGSTSAPLVCTTGVPYRLELPGWTDRGAPTVPVSMHAVSFTEFVACP